MLPAVGFDPVTSITTAVSGLGDQLQSVVTLALVPAVGLFVLFTGWAIVRKLVKK